jgi:hypothetical protein
VVLVVQLELHLLLVDLVLLAPEAAVVVKVLAQQLVVMVVLEVLAQN